MTDRPHPDGVRLLPWPIPPWVFDAFLTGLLIVAFLRRPFADEGTTFETVDTIALLIGIGLVLTRRRYALPTLAVAVVSAVVTVAMVERPTMLLPVTVVAVYTVAAQHDRRTALIAGTVTTTVIALEVIALLDEGRLEGAGLAAIAWPAFAVAAGAAVRSGRENLAATQERAQRAEQSRELEAQRRVAEERLRIARDVHDLVAHHIAVINVQSGVADHLMETDPAAAGEALEVVRDAASTVIDQLGELLSVLRSPGDVEASTSPTPDLSAIDDLISSFTASGLSVQRETSGTRRELSGSAELAAYRVVQEALTNAHKHGDGTAFVARRFDDRGLEIAVVNPTHGGVAAGNGFGLVGMRERVEAVGGSIDAGISPDGQRFEVTARLPTRHADQTSTLLTESGEP